MAPITSICLHPNQGELILGDQSGLLHLWDLKTDHNEQLVSVYFIIKLLKIKFSSCFYFSLI